MRRYWLCAMLVMGLAGVSAAQVDQAYLGPLVAHDFEDQGAGGVTMDVSGLSPALDGTLVGGATIVWDADRQSYVLDSGTYNSGMGVRCGIDPRLSVPGVLTPWTFSCWVKPRNPEDPNWYGSESRGVQEQWRFIAGADDGAGPRCASMNSGFVFMVQMNSGAIFDGWNPTNIWRSCLWSPNCPDGYDGTGPWHHLLTTYDGYSMKAYIDGVFFVERYRIGQFMAGWADSGNKNWAIAVNPTGTDGTSHYIDDVALFQGYATPTVVQGLYDGTYDLVANLPPLLGPNDIDIQPHPPVKTPDCLLPVSSVLTFLDNNIVGWWEFEEGPGATTTADVSPNAAADAQLLADAAIAFEGDPIYADRDWLVGNVSDTPTPPGDPNLIDPNDYILVGEDTKWDWSELDDGFTICAWVKLGTEDYANDPYDGDVFRRLGHAVTDPATGATDPCTPATGIWLNIHNGGVRFSLATAGLDETEIGSAEGCWGGAKPGAWVHIAAVYTPNHPVSYDPATPSTWGAPAAGKLSIYMDAAPALNDQNLPTTCASSGGFVRGPIVPMDGLPITIGSPSKPFRGRIDSVRLYKAPFTQSVVRCSMRRYCRPDLVPGDLVNNDCAVNEADLAELVSGWLVSYDLNDFAAVSAAWLGTDLFFPYY